MVRKVGSNCSPGTTAVEPRATPAEIDPLVEPARLCDDLLVRVRQLDPARFGGSARTSSSDPAVSAAAIAAAGRRASLRLALQSCRSDDQRVQAMVDFVTRAIEESPAFDFAPMQEILAAIQGADPSEKPLFAAAAQQSAALLPEQKELIAVAVTHPSELPNGLKRLFLGPRSFEELVDWRTRVLRHLPERSADVLFAQSYARLPEQVRAVIDARAANHTIASPAGNIGSSPMEWIRNPQGGGNWADQCIKWANAGVRVVYDRQGLQAELDEWRARTRLPGIGNLGLKMPDELRRKAEALEALSTGEAISAEDPPPFVPFPQTSVSVLDLACGLLAASPVTLKYYEQQLEALPFDIPHAPLPWGTPPSLQRLWPRLKRLPDMETRREALPWMLLEFMASCGGFTGGPSTRVRLEDLDGLRNEEPLEGLYVECAPDFRSEFNRTSVLYRGSLENQAIKAIATWAPHLLSAIPTRAAPHLPAVDAVLARHPDKPLADVNIIAVQHLVDDSRVTFSALRTLGADPSHIHVLGVPYSANEQAAMRLRLDLGIDVDTTMCRGLPYKAWRTVQVCSLVRKALADHAANGKPIIVLDDGGYVTAAVHKYFPEQAHLFTIVEQTTRGITVAKQQELRSDVVAVARSKTKKLELKGVERAIAKEVTARLSMFASETFMPGKPAVVLGFGWIGQVVAEALKRMGRKVVVVDPSEEGRRAAALAGYATAEKPDEVIQEAAIIAGCSGTTSLSAQQLASLSHGPVLFSCSSSDVEFEVQSDSQVHTDMLVTGPGTCYVVLGSVFPINFSGAGLVGEAQYLQFTCAGMLEGALQARELSLGKARGQIVPLDEERDDAIVESAGAAQGWGDDGIIRVMGVRTRFSGSCPEFYIDDLEGRFDALFRWGRERDAAERLYLFSERPGGHGWRDGWLQEDEMEGSNLLARSAHAEYSQLVAMAKRAKETPASLTTADNADPALAKKGETLFGLLMRRMSATGK